MNTFAIGGSMDRALGILGIFVFIGIAFLFSENKKRINWKLIFSALILQFILAFLVLGIPSLSIEGPFRFGFVFLNNIIIEILDVTYQGTKLVFGDLTDIKKNGFIIAVQVLPTIIFISALMSVLYHVKIMEIIVRFLAAIMKKTLSISGAEALSTSANIFVGQTEAPLVIKPYISDMTRSELFCVMVGGMASIAGGVLIAYVGMLSQIIPDIAGHLLTASIMSAPATILISKIIMPETGTPKTFGSIPKDQGVKYSNIIDAAASGTSEGASLALNVGAMLVTFTALIYLFDLILINFGNIINFASWGELITPQYLIDQGKVQLSLSLLFSWIFSPLAFLMGIPYQDLGPAGVLLGKKIMVNEFVAYMDLAQLGNKIDNRSQLILSYALCGFANFASIGIQIGGIGGLAPERRSELAQMGLKCVLGGSLATFIAASIAGIFI